MHAPNILRNSTKPITMVCARLAWLYLEFWTFLFFSFIQLLLECFQMSPRFKSTYISMEHGYPKKTTILLVLEILDTSILGQQRTINVPWKREKKNKTKKQNKLYNMIPKFTKFYEGNVPSVVYNIYCLLSYLIFRSVLCCI